MARLTNSATKIAGQKLREIREQLGLRMSDVESESQRLSKLFGKSRLIFHTSALSEMETKGRPPSLHRAYVLSLIYEIGLPQILSLYGLPDMKLRYSNKALELRKQRTQEAESRRRRRCEHCGKEFAVGFPSMATRFCSSSCRGSSRSARSRIAVEQKLRKAVAKGTSYLQIAESLQIGKSTVYRLARQLGLAVRDRKSKHRNSTSRAAL
jgi:transcriptional regulator with XRE-family HTH domain